MKRDFGGIQSKVIGVLIVLGAAGMIWLEESRQRAAIGIDAPDVTFQMLDGSADVSLRSLKGKPVVLDFWASWCGPCRASLPHVDELATKLAGRAHVFAVNAESEAIGLQKGTQDSLRLKLPIATNGAMAAGTYGIEALPTIVILDRDGKVVESFRGGASSSRIESIIDRLQ